MHLDPQTYARLLAGTLPPKEARALADHLAGECERCERFVAERQEADALDGEADAAIDRAFAPRAPPGGELEFARIERRLRASGRGRRRAAALGALAASLLVAATIGLLTRHRPHPAPGEAAWDGLKGSAVAAAVHLRFVRLRPGGETLRGRSGDEVRHDESLLFELEADHPMEATLLRVAPEGAPEVVWRGRLSAGRTVLGSGGKAAAYPLAALSGAQRFVLVGSRAPLDERQLEDAARSAPGAGAAGDPISSDAFELRVR